MAARILLQPQASLVLFIFEVRYTVVRENTKIK